MAIPPPSALRTDPDTDTAVRGVPLAAAYGLLLIGTVAAATAAAPALAPLTGGLGGFVLPIAWWLAAVAAAPAAARIGTVRLSRVEFGRRGPRTTREVRAAVGTLLVR